VPRPDVPGAVVDGAVVPGTVVPGAAWAGRAAIATSRRADAAAAAREKTWAELVNMAETFREATLLVPVRPDDLPGDLPDPKSHRYNDISVAVRLCNRSDEVCIGLVDSWLSLPQPRP
jgi:hypothetical protein